MFLLLQDHELYIYIFSCFIHLESSSTSTLLDFACEETTSSFPQFLMGNLSLTQLGLMLESTDKLNSWVDPYCYKVCQCTFWLLIRALVILGLCTKGIHR